jgi:DNA polymerase-1
MDMCFRVTEAMGMPAFIDQQFESDDIIGTFTRQLTLDGHVVVIVSSDKDFAQLISPKVTLWNFARDEIYDISRVQEKFGVLPEQIIDFLALCGDPVDNIPGVAGIGPKTAGILLKHFKTLENILAGIATVADLPVRGAKSIAEKLSGAKDMALLSQQLARIAVTAPVQADMAAFAYTGARFDLLEPLFEQLGFDAILQRVPGWSEAQLQ